MAGFVLELCAGGGGQALGLETAGFNHCALIDNDSSAVKTLRLNRPGWEVIEGDLNNFDARPFSGVDLVAGGLPCPPFSIAGKKLGERDERNLFPAGLRIVAEAQPKAVMFENVRGILDPRFSTYRELIEARLKKLGYLCKWRLLNAADFGVPQLRPRVVLVALRTAFSDNFEWPDRLSPPPYVGDTLFDLMSVRGWTGAEHWKRQARAIAPTIVGGSKKHGGPDLGPTRARQAWAELGVDGRGIAVEAPHPDFMGMPKLTVRMVARLQGFPDHWLFSGKKTPAYRQVGNAFPPPVAQAVGQSIASALVRKKIKIAARQK